MHTRRSVGNLLGLVLAVLGFGLVLYAALMFLGGAWLERRDRASLAAGLTKAAPLIALPDTGQRWAKAASAPRAAPVFPTHAAATALGLGIIEIDRLGLSVLIRSSTSTSDLNKGAGWIPGTARPGEPGNVAVAGHRDTFFRDLRSVQTGDTIRLSTAAGKRFYTVKEILVVEPADRGVLRPANSSTLTLVTCFPFDFIGPAPKRFIVRAVASDVD
ncbi:MAG: class D sortase [Acidobacteriia bacterium]|nr:class D sortase [Terriglobia bacterium]